MYMYLSRIDLRGMIALFVICAATLPAVALESGVIDLSEPFEYAEQPVPNYINRDNTPASNPITNEGATLGRVLFYDKNLSVDKTVACASCHQQQHAFGDPDTVSIGVNGFTGRHSMRLINARFSNESRAFWGERASSIEEQALQPIKDAVEMGFSGRDGQPGFSVLIERMEGLQYYPPLFSNAFGDEEISEERIQL
ncbi:cytochrome-c peroxidase, partial [bacterium]|nr:cytochrome-c peroxidase [bacterium]